MPGFNPNRAPLKGHRTDLLSWILSWTRYLTNREVFHPISNDNWYLSNWCVGSGPIVTPGWLTDTAVASVTSYYITNPLVHVELHSVCARLCIYVSREIQECCRQTLCIYTWGTATSVPSSHCAIGYWKLTHNAIITQSLFPLVDNAYDIVLPLGILHVHVCVCMPRFVVHIRWYC